ncbi:hypothetical protein D3C81_1025950 [compost metagenome]
MQFAAPQLARQGQVIAHLGQLRDGIDFLLALVPHLQVVRRLRQTLGDLLLQRTQVGHEGKQQHLHLLAGTGAADADGARRHGAAFGQLDDDLIGDDLAIAGAVDHHARAGDDAAFRALHVYFAAQRLQHGTGSDALDAHVAMRIEGRAAHQVALQPYQPAMRVQMAIHVAMDGDVAAIELALLLHFAVLLVGGAQLQIARGAAADAFSADDLVFDRHLAVLIDIHIAILGGNEEIAIAEMLDRRAWSRHRGQIQFLRRGRRQRLAGQVVAGQAGRTRQ